MLFSKSSLWRILNLLVEMTMIMELLTMLQVLMVVVVEMLVSR